MGKGGCGKDSQDSQGSRTGGLGISVKARLKRMLGVTDAARFKLR